MNVTDRQKRDAWVAVHLECTLMTMRTVLTSLEMTVFLQLACDKLSVKNIHAKLDDISRC